MSGTVGGVRGALGLAGSVITHGSEEYRWHKGHRGFIGM